MSSATQTVLVTGAAGFIGSHLVERLVSAGLRVRALVHYNSRGSWGWLDRLPLDVQDSVEIIPGDVVDQHCIRSAVRGCSTVYHLAALIGIPYSYRCPESYVNTNIHGTFNVLQASLDEGVSRVVHTSTSEVYGSARFVPITEEHPLQGQSPYSASKIAADKLAESYYLSMDLPVVTVRPFNTFGPRQSTRAVIPTIITQALVGGVVSLGATDTVRDFNYVSDTVSGFVLAGSRPEAVGKDLNLGTGVGVTIGEVVKLVGEILGKELQTHVDAGRLRPEKSEVTRLIADSTRAQQLLGWRPAMTLREGLVATINWLRESSQLHRTGKYSV